MVQSPPNKPIPYDLIARTVKSKIRNWQNNSYSTITFRSKSACYSNHVLNLAIKGNS